ncbi:hypothetical protein KC725_05030 [Candidatus Peregrinibacteria bacterium]|nr:hypothetical protein [Candidatus Peregrinibacteria bacterium]
MDAQSFMYWAIGGGVILLVLFFCIALFYVIRILRDISDATASVRDTAETVNENVQELAGKVTSTADQILTYFVKPFAIFQFFADKVKPFMDMIPNMQGDDDEDFEDDDEPKKKRRTSRRRKK